MKFKIGPKSPTQVKLSLVIPTEHPPRRKQAACLAHSSNIASYFVKFSLKSNYHDPQWSFSLSENWSKKLRMWNTIFFSPPSINSLKIKGQSQSHVLCAELPLFPVGVSQHIQGRVWPRYVHSLLWVTLKFQNWPSIRFTSRVVLIKWLIRNRTLCWLSDRTSSFAGKLLNKLRL